MTSAWTYLLGLDPGIRDLNGITVGAWREYDPVLYIAESYELKAIPSELAAEVKRLESQYPFTSIHADEGGLGKAFAEEMRIRFSIPVKPVAKHDKAGWIRLFNGDLKSGRIKVVRSRCEKLLDEWRDLPWRPDGMREMEGYECNCADSALYMYRASRAYHEAPEAPKPTLHEAMRQMERDLIEQRVASIEAEQSLEWWQR